MKTLTKTIICLSIIGLISSCSTESNIQPQDISGFTYGTTGRGRINTYVIDSCEYIGILTGLDHDILTHKGNCKNPIHYRNKDSQSK